MEQKNLSQEGGVTQSIGRFIKPVESDWANSYRKNLAIQAELSREAREAYKKNLR